jgi:tetratricopeptide (TPR) repeat protein
VAFFGFPLAHEGEAERAVRAALEILERLAATEVPEMGRVRVRVGIATGVVVVSAAEKSAVGETMNLASRLQGLAQPGEIVVSDRVQRLAGGSFQYVDLGCHELKGLPGATQAWRVAGERREVSRFEATRRIGGSTMVGRTRELAALRERWSLALDGHGQLVLLSGEPGIGKSRTVSGMCETLEAEGARTLRMQCSPFQVNAAFHPFTELLGRLLQVERGEAAEHRLERVRTFLVETMGRPEADVVHLASLLSVPWRDRYAAPAISARRMREESIRVLVDLLVTMARRQQTVFFLEDTHWADPSTLDVLATVVARSAEGPMFWLLTARPEFVAPWTGFAHVSTLGLLRLDASESRAIIDQLTAGKQMPPSLVDQIVRKTDGVPLFVEELTQAVLESGELRDVGDRYALIGGSHGFTLPATLRDSLMSRLDRVRAVKELAQVGSAIGREFSYELLAAVAPVSGDALDDALHRMTASGLVLQYGSGADARYTFKHALLQDVAYDSMLRSRRQALHRRIAAALEGRADGIAEHEPDQLARHYSAAGMDAEALPFWRKAGDLAIQRVAYPEAIAHWRTGLASMAALPDDDERPRLELALRTRLGPAEMAMRGWGAPQVAEILEPAWTLNQRIGDREASLPLLHSLWVHLMSRSRLATSLEWAERMLTEGERIDDPRLVICGHRAAMTSYYWLGRYADAKHHGDQILEQYNPAVHGSLAIRTNSDPLTGDGIYRAQYLWMLGYPDQARAVSRATSAHARERQHPFDMAFALTLGAQSYEYCGDADSLLAGAEEAMRIGRDFGVPLMSEMMAEISRGKAWLLQHRTEDGTALLRASVERLAGTGHRVWIAHLTARVGYALAQQGGLAEGLALITESLERDDCREDRAHLAETLRFKGEVLAAMGRPADAMTTMLTGLDVARGQNARGWELRLATSIARLHAEAGALEAARRVLGPVHAWFTEGFDTHDWLAADRLLAALRGESDLSPLLRTAARVE